MRFQMALLAKCWFGSGPRKRRHVDYLDRASTECAVKGGGQTPVIEGDALLVVARLVVDRPGQQQRIRAVDGRRESLQVSHPGRRHYDRALEMLHLYTRVGDPGQATVCTSGSLQVSDRGSNQ